MRPLIVACFVMVASAALLADDLIPLNDLGPAPYRYGYFGGLYENGSNVVPADHLAAGLALAKEIQPLDENGHPSPSGKIAFMVAGAGDTDRVACSLYWSVACEPGSFVSMVRNNPRVNPSVVVINAAYEEFQADLPAAFERIQDSLLPQAGVTDQQVQVAWLQMSSDHPSVSIVRASGDGYNLKIIIAAMLRSLQAHYPNLRIAYLSSRPYGGDSANAWNSEPYAYETGLSVRWVILEQITQARTGVLGNDTRVGQINYHKGQAPWVAWGPYMWANGTSPRSDGLTWLPEDYDDFSGFLSERGAHKAATMLLDFLLTDPTTRSWFAANAGGRGRTVRH